MSTLNPYVFPLVPLTDLAPELALRAGMGSWEPYGLPAPSDRLLPFVLARRQAPSNAPWVSCAWIVNAATGERVVTLAPTGAQAQVPTYGLVLSKLVDAGNQAEYFTYAGAQVPGLHLPCGVPLRLIVDNAYQSPLFYALAAAAELAVTHLPLEWYDAGPLQGVPYGRGFRQRFYLFNGSLQQLDAREDEAASKDPDTGAETVLSLSVFNQQQFTLDPVPAYLAQALQAARAPRFFLADGQPWKLLSVKLTPSGEDGGRWKVTGTVEDQTPLLRRGCAPQLLPLEAYDPATTARGWRCGDPGDTAPDVRPTGSYSCEVNDQGENTGFALQTTQDVNPQSPSYGQPGPPLRVADAAHCPVPVTYASALYGESAQRSDCGAGYVGAVVRFEAAAGQFTSRQSQAAADAQAVAYVQAGKQAYANAHGSCTAAVYDPVYTSSGCFSGQMVNVDDPTDQRPATGDELARYGGGTDNYGNPCP